VTAAAGRFTELGSVPAAVTPRGLPRIVCAKHLTDSYTRIVDAKYPDINSVENVCQLKRDAVASDIAGSEDFIRRFAGLKSQYESASKCVAAMRQEFQNVVLTDLAQPPWKVLPSWHNGRERCGELRSRARQRNSIRRQGCGVSQGSFIGSARGHR
jgi:hypothetical protein